MTKKQQQAVDGVLKKMDKSIQQMLTGKLGGRRAWILSTQHTKEGFPFLKVYFRIPLAPSFEIWNKTGEERQAIVSNGRDTIDIASIEATPTKTGMGTYFFQNLEKMLIARNMTYVRVESVNSPELKKVLLRQGYADFHLMMNTWKKLIPEYPH